VHVLTKIFIVLVSLLAVLLVPLVVVYAHNENSYQARYQAAESKAAVAQEALKLANAEFGAASQRQNQTIQELEMANIELQRQADRQETEIRESKARLAEAEASNAQIDAKLATLSNSVDAGQKLTESLIEELRTVRADALTYQRQKVEIDEQYRDVRAQLDVAIEARRALEEELQRKRDELGEALGMVSIYRERYGVLDEVAVGGVGGRPSPVDLVATIISVRRSQGQNLAEIDAGSRDGLIEGVTGTIGFGGQFIAKLRIISVDINRATGVIELEELSDRGLAEVNHRVYFRAGQ
jgi:hypothetical protein